MAIGKVDLPKNTWVKIVDGSGMDKVSFQVKGGKEVLIAATTADSAPTGAHEDWPDYDRSEGEFGADMTALFAGVSGIATTSFLWAYCPDADGSIWRSHA